MRFVYQFNQGGVTVKSFSQQDLTPFEAGQMIDDLVEERMIQFSIKSYSEAFDQICEENPELCQEWIGV